MGVGWESGAEDYNTFSDKNNIPKTEWHWGTRGDATDICSKYFRLPKPSFCSFLMISL